MAESRTGSTPRQPQQPPGKPAEPSESGTPPVSTPTASAEDRGEEGRQDGQPRPATETSRQTAEPKAGPRSRGAEMARSAGTAEVPATEKPIYNVPVKETSAYVVTVDNRTGHVTKIERLNEEGGERKEISAAEYAYLLTYWGLAIPSTVAPGGLSATSSTSQTHPLVQSYLQGMIDYYNTYAVPQ